MLIGVIASAHAQGNSPAPSADPVKKAKGLQKELKLTDAQTSKVAAVYKESAQKFDKIKADEHGNTNKMLEAVRPLRANTIKKIKAILTPAQSAKYDALLKGSNNSDLNSGWSGGWGSAA